MTTNSHRIFGLDVLRTLAIVIVVISHSGYLLGPVFPFIPLPDGVDLFFVLSGFLVGGILIREAEKNQGLSSSLIFNFLKRRWFRTLPNYFLFLIINIVLIYFGCIAGELNKYLVTYFVFFQYLYKPFDFLFWESWSLCVEEWFYLLFPFIAVLVFTFISKKIKQVFAYTILLFIVTPLIYRIFIPSVNDNQELYYRMIVLCRLDSIGYGLAGAFVMHYYQNFWVKFKHLSFAIGIGLMVVLFYLNPDKGSFFYKSTFFSLNNICILFMLPILEGLKQEKVPLKPFALVSKISYSMYLVNIPLLQLLTRSINDSREGKGLLIYTLYWFLLFTISFIIYRFFEKPMTNLREK